MSVFLKDFMKKQEIKGMHLLRWDSSNEEIQQLIETAHANFPNAIFLWIITDSSEGVEGQKDYTRLLGNLHTCKVLTCKSVTLSTEDKVEQTFCLWCIKALGTAGPLFVHMMEHYCLVLGCGRCYHECFESGLTFRLHYWSCKGATPPTSAFLLSSQSLVTVDPLL